MNQICDDYANSATTFAHLPEFSEFVRPRTLDELILPAETIDRLKRVLDSKNPPNMLFHGSPGTGKSSCASIFASNDTFLVHRFNCADPKTKQTLKTELVSIVKTPSLMHSQKLVIFEESDQLPIAIQLNLRDVIESSIHQARFIFTCNDRSLIDPAIDSRLIAVCFDPLFARRDECLEKVTSTIMRRLLELDTHVDREKVHEIARSHFPDYRKIAKLVEFILM